MASFINYMQIPWTTSPQPTHPVEQLSQADEWISLLTSDSAVQKELITFLIIPVTLILFFFLTKDAETGVLGVIFNSPSSPHPVSHQVPSSSLTYISCISDLPSILAAPPQSRTLTKSRLDRGTRSSLASRPPILFLCSSLSMELPEGFD